MLRFAIRLIFAGGLACWPVLGADAPQPPTAPLTLKDAVALAAKNYPAIRASLAEVSAAASEVDLAKTSYLPRTDLYYQVNRATRNNVFGLILPNGVVPAISGPVIERTTISSTWGSAAGLLFSWELFDFGLRKANVELADALRNKAQAGAAVTEYEVSLAVVESYFAALAARQAVLAARANVERMEVFLRSVEALVRSQLRPGADESRARAELARARTELYMAERLEQESRAELARWLGLGGRQVEVAGGALLAEPPTRTRDAADLGRHPLAVSHQTALELVRARQKALRKSYRPKVELLSAVYGRGTGARLDGAFEGAASGLAPATGNWAVGLAVSFPVFDYKENQVRRQIESHNERKEQARLGEVLERLRAEVEKARVQVDSARRIAANTPVELEAARTLEMQARARYQAELGTAVEVAEAQRLLRQAETDDALAKLGVWKALFALAAAEGDMSAMLEASSRP